MSVSVMFCYLENTVIWINKVMLNKIGHAVFAVVYANANLTVLKC